jgi:predicted nucleotidyltransferase
VDLTSTLLEKRKIDGAFRRSEAAHAICDTLAAYAAAHGGRYLVYGSVARGAIRHDSDIDLLIDFPEDAQADAWRFAEEACGERGMPHDIRPLSWCKAAFLERILPGAMVLK